MLRVCRVAKERSEEAPVVLQNFQFRMEDDAEAFAKARLSFPFFTDRFGVGALHLIVIGENDRLFAGEIIVGGTGGDFGGPCDVAHGSDFEAATTKQSKSSLEDQLSCLLAG